MSPRKSDYRMAVGLSYDGLEHEAPTLEVKGEQLFADKIVKTAKRYGVPVVEHRELARVLAALDVGEQIPEKLFEAVAIVLNQIESKLAPKA